MYRRKSKVKMPIRTPMNTTEGNNSKIKKPRFDEGTVNYVSSSKVELDTFAFIWSIENFGGLPENEEFHSPIYRGGPATNHNWQLILIPNAPSNSTDDLDVSDDDDGNYNDRELSVFLCYTGTEGGNQNHSPVVDVDVVKASFEISLLDDANKQALYLGSSTKFHDFDLNSKWGLKQFFPMESLMDPAEGLIHNDTLKIHCRLWIQQGFKHTTVNGGQGPVILSEEAMDFEKLKELRFHLLEGLENSTLTDVSVVTETKTFKAHKFMLAARSPVFKIMFSSEMREATENSVIINDFDEVTVEAMLHFIYSGKAPGALIPTDKSCDLLRIADKYELHGLKEICEEVLGNTLDPENVAEVLAIASMHQAPQLKANALKFINRNKKVVEKTEGFKEFVQPNASLLNDLYLSL